MFLGCVAVVAAVYLAGPRLEREEVDRVLPVVACEDVEGYVREREAALPVKPGMIFSPTVTSSPSRTST